MADRRQQLPVQRRYLAAVVAGDYYGFGQCHS
jgi:hypothetical protein